MASIKSKQTEKYKIKTVAIVLAGAGQHSSGIEQIPKAQLEYNGKPLVEGVLQALQQSSYVSDVVYVGQKPFLACLSSSTYDQVVTKSVAAGETLPASLEAGWNVAKETMTDFSKSRILLLAADLPWLEPAALDDLLEVSLGYAAGYGVVSREAYVQDFPQHQRTYATFRNEKSARGKLQVTGGNAFVIEARAFGNIFPYVKKAYQYRKNPLRLTTMVGVDMVLRYGLGCLSLAELEARVSRILDLPIHVHLSPHPSLAADVDKLAHLSS